MTVVTQGLARQIDPTTCGSAVLVAVQAAGQGRLHEVLHQDELTRLPAQAAMKLATSRRALGPLSWPSRLGTPPWTAKREARYPGVRYAVAWLAPWRRPRRDASVWRTLFSAASRAIPVPLYVGGAPGQGAQGLPRHVVLILSARPGDGWRPAVVAGQVATDVVWRLYEPSSGTIHEVSTAELHSKQACAAFGGWSHVWAALVPYPED